MEFFHQEAQYLAQKMGFKYEKEVAEKMIEYAEEKLPNHSVNKEHNLKDQTTERAVWLLKVTKLLYSVKSTQHFLKGVEHALNAV